MKKNVILLCLMMVPLLAYSQVGVGTSNPEGALHVDGAKDNPLTGTPTSVQQSNDLTVASTGYVGVGTTAPVGRLHVYNHTAGVPAGNDYLFDDESAIVTTDAAGLLLRRSNAGGNLAQDDLIGAMMFNPKVNGTFGYAGAGIAGIYRGDGTTNSTALSFRINSNQEAARIDENGNVGIGTIAPTARLEINSGTADVSGLKLTNLTSATPVSAGATLGIDAAGNVVTVTGTAFTPVSGTIGSAGTVTIPSGTAVTLVTFTLPSPGTYLITYSTRGQIEGETASITTFLTTEVGAVIGNTQILVTASSGPATASGTGGGTGTGSYVVTVNAATTYLLRASCTGGNGIVYNNADGRTLVSYVKIAP